MAVLQRESEQQAFDQARASVDQLSPAVQKRLLSHIARRCLTAGVADVPLQSEDGSVFAYVQSTERPEIDFASMFTPQELKDITRNLTDPKYAMSSPELLSRLDAADDRKSGQR